jgi:hypothetical protein
MDATTAAKRPNLRLLGGCKPKPPQFRFKASYQPEPNSGCWIWLGCTRGSHGYGGIKVNGRTIPAHRYPWELHRGPIPVGLFVLHRCDNPARVNPDHLFLGTHQDNEDDKVRKGRQACGDRLARAQDENRPRGTRVGTSKLTPQEILEIKRSALSQKNLGAMYEVSQPAIWAIKTGKTWRWL